MATKTLCEQNACLIANKCVYPDKCLEFGFALASGMSNGNCSIQREVLKLNDEVKAVQ